jgi:autotransporter-associated beta strand protein
MWSFAVRPYRQRRSIARALLVAACMLAPRAAHAGSGIFESFVVVDKGAGNGFYDLASNTGNPDWQGFSLGAFNAGGSTNGGAALTLNGGQIKTFQNSGDDINGAFIHYRVTRQGDTPGSFGQISLFFQSQAGNGDKTWEKTAEGLAVLNSLSPGTYNFDVYGRAHGVNNGFNFDLFANNGGNNYTATFTVNISDFLWDGGGSPDGATSNASNWSNNIAPAAGHNIAFAGSTNTSVSNTFSNVNKVTFNSGASPFTVGGNALTVNGGGIVNNSGNTQTINANLTLGANQSLDAGTTANGALAIGGTLNTNAKALTVTGANNTTISGAISGSGSITKQGNGRLTLATGVTHTYTGTTIVSNGSLYMNGAHNGGDSYSVASGATLGGDGVITLASSKHVVVSGNLAPGNSAGKLTINTSGGGATELAQGGSYTWEINGQTGPAGVDWDLLDLDAVSVSATSTTGQQFTIRVVSLNGSNQPGQTPGWQPGDLANPKRYTIATSSTNSFAGLDVNKFAIDTSQFQNAYPESWSLEVGDSGGSLRLVYVPEPGALGMLAIAAASLLRRRGRGPR